jgi:hypothetical protein
MENKAFDTSVSIVNKLRIRIFQLREQKLAQEEKSAQWLIKANETDEKITRTEMALKEAMLEQYEGGR